ncbi:MAG: UDP-3-O-(3-hydroxymyristoyl)glucosamine N-acyltransferase [Saprospiraceae bacterium]|nr:UDP-3-O-(3-hydroxymyristoyl)glucosamine N-acyltransferase [Saprospiraceae bacterium]
MQLAKPIPVQSLAEEFGLQLIGSSDQMIFGINEIHKVCAGDLTFVDAEKYYHRAVHSAATVILINKEFECPEGKTLLVTEHPFDLYNLLVLRHRPERPLIQSIADTAFVHPTAIIEPGVVIGHYAVIGAGSLIQANAYIGEYSVIGKEVRIQAGAIIGSDAFYYKKTKDGFVKWRSGGRTVIMDHVEIGAGSTINKGVSGDTIVGEGTKIDCQVHLGHGVVVGKHCLFAAQVGIGGKTIIGDHVTLYGQVGVAQNLHIANHVTVLATSGVSKDLEEGKTYFGAPAEEIGVKYRELAALRGLPGFMKSKK